ASASKSSGCNLTPLIPAKAGIQSPTCDHTTFVRPPHHRYGPAMTPLSRIGILVAGILGAAGVAAAAGASHGGDTARLGSLALIALTQAPAILALSLHGGVNWLMRAGGIVVAAGAVLFC